MNIRTFQEHGLCRLPIRYTAGACISVLAIAVCGHAQVWQPSAANPNVMAAGSLSVTGSTRGLILQGDTMSGSAVVVLKAPFDVSLRFAGFGRPAGVGGTPLNMNLKLEISTAGVVFDGAAESLNSAAVNLPTATNPNGIALKLTRSLTADRNILAGQYVNNGTIVVSQM